MFARLVLQYLAMKDITINARCKNNLIRSALGATLKRRDETAFELFFQGRLLEVMGRSKERVPGFAPECFDSRCEFKVGDILEIKVVLLAPSTTGTLFLLALRQMFLGHGFRLVAGYAENVFKPGMGYPVADENRVVAVPEFEIKDVIKNYRIEQPVKELALELLTPLRLQRGGHLVSQPTFADIVFACYRRLDNIFRVWTMGTGQMPEEFSELPEDSLTIDSVSETKWHDWYRWQSKKDGQVMAMGGAIGYIRAVCTEPPYLNPFTALLKLGEILHVGKSFTMGNGLLKVGWES